MHLLPLDAGGDGRLDITGGHLLQLGLRREHRAGVVSRLEQARHSRQRDTARDGRGPAVLDRSLLPCLVAPPKPAAPRDLLDA